MAEPDRIYIDVLACGKVSMNPFDCSEAFEELIDKINSL